MAPKQSRIDYAVLTRWAITNNVTAVDLAQDKARYIAALQSIDAGRSDWSKPSKQGEGFLEAAKRYFKANILPDAFENTTALRWRADALARLDIHLSGGEKDICKPSQVLDVFGYQNGNGRMQDNSSLLDAAPPSSREASSPVPSMGGVSTAEILQRRIDELEKDNMHLHKQLQAEAGQNRQSLVKVDEQADTIDERDRTIKSLGQQLAARDRHIQQNQQDRDQLQHHYSMRVEKQNDEFNREREHFRHVLDGKEGEIRLHQENLDQVQHDYRVKAVQETSVSETLRHELLGKDVQIDRLRQQLAGRDDQIRKLEGNVKQLQTQSRAQADKDTSSTEILHELLGHRDDQIRRLEESAKQVQSQSRARADKDTTTIERLRHDLAGKDAKIQVLEESVEQLQTDFNAARLPAGPPVNHQQDLHHRTVHCSASVDLLRLHQRIFHLMYRVKRVFPVTTDVADDVQQRSHLLDEARMLLEDMRSNAIVGSSIDMGAVHASVSARDALVDITRKDNHQAQEEDEDDGTGEPAPDDRRNMDKLRRTVDAARFWTDHMALVKVIEWLGQA